MSFTDMPSTFRDQFYRTYVTDHQRVLTGGQRLPTLERDVIARLPADRSARILDVGCGYGDLVALVRQHGWTAVHGIDVSQEQVDAAARLGVSGITCADIYEHAADFPGSYDVVLAMDVVEHFDRADVLELFRALRNLLVPGGCLILQTPNGTSPFSGAIYWGDITHGMQYTNRSLQQVCAAAGFASVAAFPVRPAVHGAASLARAIIWRGIESLMRLATAAETGRVRGEIFTRNLVAVARTSAGVVPDGAFDRAQHHE